MPQLLPDGLGPKDHHSVAKHALHPLARPPHIPDYCRTAIDHQKQGHVAVNAMRVPMLRLLETLAALCVGDKKLLMEAVHPWILKVV